jgi:hypothetical protein
MNGDSVAGAASGSASPVVGRRYNVPVLAAALLAISYAALLLWFEWTDFYQTHFFAHGAKVQAYQAARLAFIIYLAWLIYAVGVATVILALGAEAFKSLAPFESYPLFFILGAGIWHVVLFATGLAGLDTKPVMLTLTLGVMLLSIPHLAERLREAHAAVAGVRWRFTLSGLLRGALLLGIVGAAGLFLMVKGLYPAGGHDYFNHYFQFYKRVVETGSILPNDVWYHFFYSKGAGLYFMAMLLTDPLAPQLVTTAFILCGAGIVFALLRRSARDTLLPWVGVLLYFALLIYTPGPEQNKAEGGWADLEKIHELTAVLLLAVVWISARLFGGDTNMRGSWWLALSAAILGIALLTFVLLLLVGLYMAVFMTWFIVRGRWREALQPLAAAALAGACLLVVAAINYHYTGIPTDLFSARLWPYFDLKKVQEWGTLYEVLDYHRSVYYLATSDVPRSWDTVKTLATFLRLELWWPVIAAALPLAIWNLSSRRTRLAHAPLIDVNALTALLAFAFAVTLAAGFSGSLLYPYSISFYRLSTFSYAPTLCAALILWSIAIRNGIDQQYIRILLGVASILGTAFILRSTAAPRQWVEAVRGNVLQVIGNAAKLAGGDFSIRDAYQNQQGWPGRLPWGGIYPAMEKVRQIVGPRTRVWSFHIHSYCMLPECNAQGSFSFRFSPSWQTIIFGTAKQATDTLRSERLNYFFFSKELGVSGTDLLPASRLFSPDEIGNYLGIKWTDGTSYLLTWLGPGVEPVADKFLGEFRARLDADRFSIEGKRSLWRPISDYTIEHKNDLHPFAGPWCTNPAIRCQ